jgi:glycosyltransferase involved in cell wall biosynthesis
VTGRFRSKDVAVVIPVLNHARLLGEAIESVLGQSEPPGDLIVVDDGSTDGSGDVAAAHGVRVIRQPTQGIGTARNVGVAATTTPVIAFLDADDRWTTDKLRLQLDAMTEDVDLVSGWTAQVPQPAWDAAVHDGPRRESWRTGPVPGTLMIRRSTFDEVGPYDATLRAGESLDWHARAVDHGARIVVVPEVVLLRRVHADSHGTRQREGYVDYLKVVRMALERRRGRESQR